MNYIKSLFNLINNRIKVKDTFFYFYFMSNNNITSKLLSRYLAIKLKRNFNVFFAVSPIKRELLRLSYRARSNKKQAFKLYDFNVLFSKKKVLNKKKFKNSLIFNYILFLDQFYIYYKNNNTLIYFNIILYYKHNLKKLFFLRFLKVFNINIFYKLYIIYNKLQYYFSIKSINIILNQLYLNIFNIFKPIQNKIFYKKFLNYKIIAISTFFYINILNFEYLKYLWAKFKMFNLRNIRKQYIPKYRSYLMGFKMSFRGRFSRKQRASFMWFHEGKVPLNTLNKKIDYSFFTIPIKNSAISIKVWLHINPIYRNFKHILKI